MNRREFVYLAAAAGQGIATRGEGIGGTASFFRMKYGRYSWGPENLGVIENARLGLEIDGQTVWATAANSQWSGDVHPGKTGQLTVNAAKVMWTIEFAVAHDRRSGTIVSTIHNVSGERVHIGQCVLCDLGDGGRLWLGEGSDEAVLLALSGWQAPSRARRVPKDGKTESSKIVAQLYHAKSGRAFQLGFATISLVAAAAVHSMQNRAVYSPGQT